MQRATGQSDHLACIPGTGPRQSSSRRSFAPRHWCGATPRRSRGMEPTVRSPRIESALASSDLGDDIDHHALDLVRLGVEEGEGHAGRGRADLRECRNVRSTSQLKIPSDFPDTAITKCCRENRKCTAYLTC